jgi:threonine/homoserine/homoserine lactone efflux protein
MLNLLFPIAAFAFTSSITPGPNNFMLTASGANFGFRRTLPHMAGISVGFPVMLLAICLGLGTVFRTVPRIHDVLRYAGMVYLLWLAWKIATSGPAAHSEEKRGHPLGFFQAAGFQWINPKAWMIAAGAVTAYTSAEGDVLLESLLVAGIFVVVSFPCLMVWTSFGSVIERLLRRPGWLRIFNVAMAVLLVASMLPMVLG